MAKVVKVVDPRLEINEKSYFAALCGGEQTTYRKYDFQTYSNSSAQLAFTTPSPKVVMDRRWQLKMPVTISFQGDSGDPSRNLLQSGQDAFRQYPIQSVLNVLDIKLNGESTNLNVSDVVKPLLLYHNNERDLGERHSSLTTTARDQSQAYSQLDGSIRNPLASYYDSNQRDQMGRGGFPYDSFSNTANSASVQATLTTDLMIQPLCFGTNAQYDGFINLQDVELNFTWATDLTRMWSHSSSSASSFTSVSVVLGRPTLMVTYLTPQPNMSLPRSVDYPYNEIKRYPNLAATSTVAGDVDEITSNNIQLGAIPRFLYVFLRKQNSQLSYNDTDSYAAIQSIQVNWDNQNALLASATQEQLYNMSEKNGVDLSWTEWSGQDSRIYLGDENDSIQGIGSVLCIEFGTDIGLKLNEAVGLRDTFNLQLTVRYKNVHPTESIQFSLYLITITPGIFRIYDRSANKIVGVLNRSDILNAIKLPQLDYSDLEKKLMSGGSKFMRKVQKYAPKIAKVAKMSAMASGHPELVPLISGAEQTIKRYGKRGRKKGSSLVGGKLMNKKQLLNKLMNS
jgi:hypothetical protein